MLDKTFKVIFPLSLIITTVTAFLPDGILSFFVPYSMVILSLCIYSLGWILSSYSENPYSKEYDQARHLALAAVVSIPILALVFTPSFLYPYIVGKGFVFRFLAIIAGVSALYLSLTNENYRIKLTPFFNASLIFTVVMGISTLLSMDPSRSFFSNFERMEGYINVLLIFSLVAAVTIIRLKESEWITVFKTHVWVSGIIGTVAVLQFFIGVLSLKGFAQLPILNLCLSTGSGCRVDATLGNSIYLGLYCGLSFWLIIYAIFVRRMNSYLLMTLAGIQLLAVYFSGTRGVWVGMFLGLVTLFISKFWFDGKRKQAYMSLLAGTLFVVCLGGFIFYANQNGLYQDVGLVKRFSSMNTLFARWTIWKMALVSWTEQPLFGWGQENFIHAFNKNYDPAMYGQETYFDHPHNTYVGWLFSGGILGLFAFLYLIFSSVYGAWKSAIAREEKNDLVLPIVFAFLVTYFVHIFFVFDNLTSTLLFAMCALYFGSHTSLGVISIGITNESLKKYLSAGFTLVAVVLVILVVQRPALANSMTIEAMTYTSRHQGDPVSLIEGTKTTYENAINMNTLGTYEIREFYLQKSLEYIGLLPQVQDEKLKSAITNLASSAHSNFLNQVNQNPFDHRAAFMLGLYYLNIKNIDMAIPQLKKAVDLAPNKQLPLTYLAKAYLLKGDFTNASLYYEKAIDLTPSSLAGKNALRLEYIQTLLLTGQDLKAVSMIRELVPTASRDEFNSLVSQMTQVFSARKDVNSIVKTLDDASKVDPSNQNFVIWLAQALVAKGDFQAAVGVINRLSTSNPEIVAQFMSQLQAYIGALQEKQNAEKK